ncbi:MAG: peptide chain release factor N(5)-glutamine methyltransferase [Alphaproteobacteria bacterium]|nr:peptide chain release factor N(5)-glutamine methyltransferase [Alphaproteobacteria bacterium]
MKINQAFTILQRAGGLRAARIITDNNRKLSRLRVYFIAWQLRRGTPVAKIIHQKWFYGLPFYTNRHTLDPRPDTETLVSAVIADGVLTPRILDLGTGTGCVLISLIKNIPGARGVGLDISRGAARVARRNVRALCPGGATIMRRSYHRPQMPGAPFDIIVSNPPYIAHGDNRVDDGARHDPAMALYAAHNGYAEYEIIAKNARNWIRRAGRIYLEIGDGMSDRVCDIFCAAGWRFVRSEQDLAGITRVLVFEK